MIVNLSIGLVILQIVASYGSAGKSLKFQKDIKE